MSDTLETLEQRLKDIDATLEARRLGNALERASKALDGALAQIDRIETLSAFVPLIQDELDESERTRLTDGFRQLLQTGNEAVGAKESDQLVKLAQTLREALPLRVNLVRDSVQRAWWLRLDREFEGTAELAAVLSDIPQTAATGQALAEIAHQVAQLRGRLDDAQAQGQQLQVQIEARQRCNAQIEAAGADAEVTDFLLATANGSATLSHCTEEVLAWILEHDAADRFQVRLMEAKQP